MMKLNTEALSYAHAIYCQRETEIFIDTQKELEHIQVTVSPSNPRIPEITKLMYEKHRLLMLARVESYLEAYKLFNTSLDSDDIHNIAGELLNITSAHHGIVMRLEGLKDHWMPMGNRPIDNIPQYLMDRFHVAKDQAINRLRAGRVELIAEAQKRSGQPSHHISIGGDNYGNIQQDGNGNTQSIRSDDEGN
jgi:hypothetical protein